MGVFRAANPKTSAYVYPFGEPSNGSQRSLGSRLEIRIATAGQVRPSESHLDQWSEGEAEVLSALLPHIPSPPWNGGKAPTLLLWASVSLSVYPARPCGSGPARAAHLGAIGPLLPRLEDAAAAALAALVEALQSLQVDAQV